MKTQSKMSIFHRGEVCFAPTTAAHPQAGAFQKHFVWLLLALVLFAAPVLAQDDAFPRTLTDGLGVEVTILAEPQRIVSLTLSSDAVLLDLVAPERIAALTELSLDPGISNSAIASAAFDTHIAAAEDVEQVISLEPDLLLVASYTAPEVVEQYRQAGLTVFSTASPNSFAAIASNIRLIGQAVGAEDRAEAIVAQMESEIEAVSAAVAGRGESVRVLYLTPNNYTSGVDSSISEIIAAAGGVDLAAEAGIEQYAPLSDEFIIEQDPDIILLSGWTPWDPTFVDEFINNPAFSNLAAVQNRRVYTANDAHLSTVSHYIAEGVKDVAAYLYPDLYPAYPLTLTDAANAAVTVAAYPGAVIVTEAHADLLNALLEVVGDDRAFDLLITDLQDRIGTDRDAVLFLPADAPDPSIDAPSLTIVRLYAGDSPAEQIENTLMMGTALGARAAALDVVAGLIDAVEVQG